MLSFNQSHTLYSVLNNSQVDIYSINGKKEFTLNIKTPLVQAVLFYHSNIIFLRNVNGFMIWDMVTNKCILEQNKPDLCEIVVSRKYIALCYSNFIQLLYTSSLTIYQTFPLTHAYQNKTCCIEYYEGKTTFIFSGGGTIGSFHVYKENSVTTVQTQCSTITALFLNCEKNRIVSVSTDNIIIFELSTLRYIRRCKNMIGLVHSCSFSSIGTCFCSNEAGCTQGISELYGKDICIAHRRGVYIVLNDILYFVSLNS